MFICEQTHPMLEAMGEVNSFDIYFEGAKRTINKELGNFEKLRTTCCDLFSNSRIMPAFGVSLHAETQNAIKKDMWIEIHFNKEMMINDLPFSSLLFRLEQTGGINLIRNQNGRYEGRCIFIDFDEQIDLISLFGEIVDF